jgi:DNA-binding transcriptional ArsR family regulator
VSVLATSWVWGLDLPASTKLVALALADHADEQGVCWPSLARLTARTGTHRATVLRHLRALEDAGVISRERRWKGEGERDSTRYVLPRLAAPGVVADCDGGSRSLHLGVGAERDGGRCRARRGVGAERDGEPSVEPSLNQRRGESPTGASRGFDPRGAEIPESLDLPAFLSAWQEWCAHREEIRKRLTPTSVRRQLRELAAMGPRRAVRAIEHTIARGWQGIREPDPAGGAGRESPRRDPTIVDADELLAERDRRRREECA